MPKQLRKTKIVCTLGPATESVLVLEKLMKAGMNVARLNFSHGNYGKMKEMIENVRQAAKNTGKTIAIFQDLQGPKIRVGDLGEGINLVEGKKYNFVGGDKFDGKNIPIPVKEVIAEIAKGDCLLFGDGDLKVQVTKKIPNGFEAVVIYGGLLKSKKGIIGENKTFSLSALTTKDYEDIDWGYKNKIGFDYIAFSFVKSAEDVRTLKAYLKKKHKDTRTKVIVKFETAEAVQNMDEIVTETDALMVARGDLALEVPYPEMPIIQKKLVEKCIAVGKPVIVATNMLESMIVNPLPTRAEVTDISNAVWQRASAIMLSGETSVGKFPVRCVEVMDKIARRVEEEQRNYLFEVPPSSELDREMTRHAAQVAKNLDTDMIVVFTLTGRMAKLISKCRPTVPIIAFTENERSARQLALHWGVYAEVIKFHKNPEIMVEESIEALKNGKEIRIQKGHNLVIVSDILIGRDRVNSALQVCKIN